jgi:hypothetical protein
MLNHTHEGLASYNDRAESPRPEPATALPEIPPPRLRFGLRHLFWFLTAACVLLALIAGFPEGGYAPIALMLAIAVVSLHLISTAVGCRLRTEADKQTRYLRPAIEGAAVPTEPDGPAIARTPIRSPLHQRGHAMPWLPAVVAAGAACGGATGAILLEFSIGNRATGVGIAVGAVSTAVLGGWFAFLASNFWAILRQGWADAIADHK